MQGEAGQGLRFRFPLSSRQSGQICRKASSTMRRTSAAVIAVNRCRCTTYRLQASSTVMTKIPAVRDLPIRQVRVPPLVRLCRARRRGAQRTRSPPSVLEPARRLQKRRQFSSPRCRSSPGPCCDDSSRCRSLDGGCASSSSDRDRSSFVCRANASESSCGALPTMRLTRSARQPPPKRAP